MIEFTERGVKGSRQLEKGSISQNLVCLFDIFAEDPVFFGIVDMLADQVVCLIEKLARSERFSEIKGLGGAKQLYGQNAFEIANDPEGFSATDGPHANMVFLA